MSDKTFRRIILILQIATFFLFLGRAWQHLFWDAPFRALLWDESWMSGIISSIFNISWENYITSPDIDYQIQMFIKGIGWFYILCAIMALMIQKWQKLAGFFMVLGSISLVILAALYCKEKFFSIGQFFEYSIQFSTPALLFWMVKKQEVTPKIIYAIRVIIALTFVCHGLYAINYYPRPGFFVDMTISILKVSEATAEWFLTTAGILDFVIGIGVFLPFRYSKFIIIYAIIWGFLTTLARIWANVYFDFFWESFHQWWFESAYRVAHFLIPMILFLILSEKINEP